MYENNEAIPKHIAIIMDGNRRWAKEKGKDPKYGHIIGAEVLEKMVKYANKIGIQYLTVYAFSTENWNREKLEVNALMELLGKYILKFNKLSDKENISVRILGDKLGLKEKLQKDITKIEEKTKNATGLKFNIALNYGGRQELVRSIKKIMKEVEEGNMSIADITEKTISDNLYTKDMPDPDLMIRTSGEMRTSNFLPYQTTYSELYFLKKHWPDFTEKDLDEAIEEYNKRTRKFGAS